MVYKFFDKKLGSGGNVNKFKRRKVYTRFRYNIWAADLAEMGSLSSKNWSVYCVW